MIDEIELCHRAGITSHMLRAWIGAGWIHPQAGCSGAGFSDMDLARTQLIRDLAGPMGVNREGVAVILGLLDQIHGLRRTLRRMNSVIAIQDTAVCRRIRCDVHRVP
jgi:chaperone modulatory protein CbpM